MTIYQSMKKEHGENNGDTIEKNKRADEADES